MIIETLLAAVIAGPAQAPISCPIMGSPVSKSQPFTEYAGARYSYCCGGCSDRFEADPAKALANPKLKGKVTGEFLFDPVARQKVDLAKAPAYRDYNGVRYRFATTANAKTFDANPSKFAAVPKTEVLSCTVMGHGLGNYGKAGAYADHKGVRYFFCCGDCQAAFGKDADKYTGKGPKPSAPRAVKA